MRSNGWAKSNMTDVVLQADSDFQKFALSHFTFMEDLY